MSGFKFDINGFFNDFMFAIEIATLFLDLSLN